MTDPILTLTPELESEFRQRIEARNKKLAASKSVQSKNANSDYSPSDFIKFCLLKVAEMKKTNCPEKSDNSSFDERDLYYRDEHGRNCIKADDLRKLNDAKAIERHGNDPNIRFDEWGFPGTPSERKFLLSHDFGSAIKNSLIALESGKWVYAFGEVGNGKTALAIRTAWEFLKSRPSRKASFVFMNQYSLDQIRRESSELAAMRRGDEVYGESLNFHNLVILDDFDKVNYRNEYKTRTALDLIERLKKEPHRVFITSQISLGELYTRYEENWDMKPLIDRLRQMCLILPEFKGKSKRRGYY